MISATDDTPVQTFVRRKDVHAAVKNILMNEFKVLPGDCVDLVSKRIDDKIERAVEKVMTWYTNNMNVRHRIEAKVAQLEREAQQVFLNTVATEAKRFIADHAADIMLKKLGITV